MSSLVPRFDHLLEHRWLIVTRSMAAGLAGLVPVPLLDDWTASMVRRAAVRRIADLRGVDVTEDAVRILADGPEPPPTWRALFKANAIALLLRRGFRKALLALAIAQRADEIGRTFATLTLLDHYCARIHVGAGLDAEAARGLREVIDTAVAKNRGGLVGRLVKRGVLSAARAPVDLAWRRLRARRGERDEIPDAVPESVIGEALEREARVPQGFLGKAARAVEDELARAGSLWLAEMVQTFETTWRKG